MLRGTFFPPFLPSHPHTAADCLIFTKNSYPNTGSTAANPRTPQPNPKDRNLPRETTGPIASDSLAAESLSSGGAFANNENAHRMDVKGSSSTFNTADTSNAAELPSAPDAARRDGDNKVKYPEGAGKPSFQGVHDEHGYVGGPSRDREAQKFTGSGEYATGQARSSTGHSSGEQYRANAAADPAPTAFGNFQREGNLKPKGKNITKDDSIPSSDNNNNNNNNNTTTVPGDIGGPQDPRRVAERKMLSRDADTSAGGNAGGARQYGIERSTGEFDVLSSEALTHPRY
jgi:hypothetical protein